MANAPKLPVKQLAILAVARFAEPLALTSVFPYLPEMIRSFGVPRAEVARWAGLTGAIFSISQSTTAILWGRASDRFGRKPIILIGLLSTMTCFILWGLSRSLTMAITVRAIMGGGSGNVGILRTMVAEMVTEKSLQPVAFSIMPLVWSIGSSIGPSLGGSLAQPAKQFPDLFGDSWLFNRYPFLLPNLVCFVIFSISWITGLLFLKETLESKRHTKDWGIQLGEKLTRTFQRTKHVRIRRLSFVDDEAQAPLLAVGNQSGYMTNSRNEAAKSPTATRRPSMKEIFHSQTVINLISYTFLALHSVAFEQVLTVFLDYPRPDPITNPDGYNVHLPFQFSIGFGLSSYKIGRIFTIYGIICGLIQILVFPWLCARFGVLKCFRTAVVLFPMVYVLIPYTALFENVYLRYGSFMFLILAKGAAVIVGFPCTTILLTNSARSMAILGTLNGIATTVSGIGRAVGPASAGSAFTWGVKHGYIITAFWFLAAIAALGVIPSFYIVEGEGPHREVESEEVTEAETLVSEDESIDGEDNTDAGAAKKKLGRR